MGSLLKPFSVNLRIFYKGKFETKEGLTTYKGGCIHNLNCVANDRLSVDFLKEVGQYLCKSADFDMWYRRYGVDLTNGRTLLLKEVDVVQLLRTMCKLGTITLYITQPKTGVTPRITRSRGKRDNEGEMQVKSDMESTTLIDKKPIFKAHPKVNAQPNKNAQIKIGPSTFKGGPSTFKAPRKKEENIINELSLPLKSNPRGEKKNHKTESLQPLRRSPRQNKTNISTIVKQPPATEPNNSDLIPLIGCNVISSRAKLPIKRPLHFVDNLGPGFSGKQIDNSGFEVGVEAVEVQKSKVVGFEAGVDDKVIIPDKVTEKGKGKQIVKGRKKTVARKFKGKGKVVLGKGKEKVKEKVEVGDLEDEFTDSDISQTSDPEFEQDEYDVRVEVEEDLFAKADGGVILETVQETVEERGKGAADLEERGKRKLIGVDDLEVKFIEEEGIESDELRSLHGSDDEVDSNSCFNPVTDFSKSVRLSLGLKFPSVEVFRKALVHHSVSNGYDFYYSHNGKDRVTAYCRHRCKCPWNSKKSKFGECSCGEEVRKCKFRVHATEMENENTFQIKGLNLKHNCVRASYNRKVNSEFLAEKYLEFFRDNIDWKLKKFQSSVLRELGVHVSYMKCWYARARAKLIIYGNGSDQYAHVWDYAAAILKYNRGSSAFVVCDSIERPPPIFKRMYICLAACKEGFTKGCRPILGVDGCHLKGVYPGICLVAVGLDGNNNIYPVAWAVVEVENRDSWTWFLELLASDLDKVEGEGLTFMSDRQKGLLDALSTVVPKANVRFCARHIWANFKLSFSGQVFKESFWAAARATTKAEFDNEMNALKSLSTEAWEYLNAIPPRHWSRHAFDTECKSNLLLNNLCEVFNAVLKEARDKPILTHMEWMRRYVMERICQKREGGNAYKERLMPYVNKYMEWAEKESRLCKWSRAYAGVYEVIYKGEQCCVDLNFRTCTCFHWNLSGLPCPHAMCCINLERSDPKDYVHEAYTKAKYQMTYEPAVFPMPGVKHWEKTGLPEPLPPPMKTMPGRPKSKRRRKEPGEDEARQVKRMKKTNKCGNCGGSGHSRRTCKNPRAPPVTDRAPGGRPLSKSQWAKEMRQRKVTRAGTRAPHGTATANATSSQAGPSTSHTSAPSTSNPHANLSFTQLLSQASNNLL